MLIFLCKAVGKGNVSIDKSEVETYEWVEKTDPSLELKLSKFSGTLEAYLKLNS